MTGFQLYLQAERLKRYINKSEKQIVSWSSLVFPVDPVKKVGNPKQ